MKTLKLVDRWLSVRRRPIWDATLTDRARQILRYRVPTKRLDQRPKICGVAS